MRWYLVFFERGKQPVETTAVSLGTYSSCWRVTAGNDRVVCTLTCENNAEAPESLRTRPGFIELREIDPEGPASLPYTTGRSLDLQLWREVGLTPSMEVDSRDVYALAGRVARAQTPPGSDPRAVAGRLACFTALARPTRHAIAAAVCREYHV